MWTLFLAAVEIADDVMCADTEETEWGGKQWHCSFIVLVAVILI